MIHCLHTSRMMMHMKIYFFRVYLNLYRLVSISLLSFHWCTHKIDYTCGHFTCTQTGLELAPNLIQDKSFKKKNFNGLKTLLPNLPWICTLGMWRYKMKWVTLIWRIKAICLIMLLISNNTFHLLWNNKVLLFNSYTLPKKGHYHLPKKIMFITELKSIDQHQVNNIKRQVPIFFAKTNKSKSLKYFVNILLVCIFCTKCLRFLSLYIMCSHAISTISKM